MGCDVYSCQQQLWLREAGYKLLERMEGYLEGFESGDPIKLIILKDELVIQFINGNNTK
jgi:hypothetical protein